MAFKFNPATGKLDTVADPGGADTQIQFNDAGAFGASADLTWDDTGKVLDVGGDINLDDGGTYETTLQVVTATANRTISFPNATGTVALVAGSSGQLLYNASGANAGTSTITYDGTNVTLSGRFISSLNGAASAPPGTFTGTWFTGGTSTTTKPQVLIEPTGATSTAWSTSGTGFGVNAASGFAGRLLDLQLNGTSNFNVDSTGRASVPLGTGALPSLYPGTDTNTGMWSPAADTIAASTAGLERLRIDSTGRVGIGTTSPAFALDVQVGDARFKRAASDDAAIYFGNATNNYIYGSNAANVFSIATNNSERVRIDSSGRLGLGTSSPSYPASIVYSNNAGGIAETGLYLRNSQTGNSTQIQLDGNRNWSLLAAGSLGSPAGGFNIIDNTAGNTRLTINSSGNVGIGTTSPGSALEINGASALGNLGSGAPIITLKNTNTGNFNAAQIANRDSGGNLAGGISFRNDVHGASGSTSLLFTTRTGGTSREALILTPAGTTTLNAAASTAPFIAQINSSEVARIDSSGRLLVGTSSGRTNLNSTEAPSIQLEGTNYNTSTLSVIRNSANSGNPSFVLAKSRNASVGGNTAVTSGDVLGATEFQGNDGTNFIRAATITAAVDGTPGANDMPGRLVFSTTADGAASPTERLRITSAGVLQVADAGNITVGTTTGTKIGTATTQKLGFWNKSPVVQPTTAISAATFVADSGGSIHPTSTFDGYTIAQVVAALRSVGILA